jgi:septum formation topological specificity factor MinE
MYQEEFDNLIKKMRTRNEKDNMSKLREELDNVLVKYWGVKK